MSKLRKKRNYPATQEESRQSNKEITTNEIKSLKIPRIFQRAIANAEKHGINLKPGTENNGNGNCSYESVLLNINDRECFNEKFPMSPEFYRRVWNTDLMNKILDEKIPWNPGLSRSEIQEGFQELMENGVYERNYLEI